MITKTSKAQLAALGVALAVTGCGKKSKNDNSSTTTPSDQADQTEQAMNGAEDASSALSENGGGGAGLLATAPTITRACTAASNVATVTLTYSGNGSQTATLGKASASETVTLSGEKQRVWTAPTAAAAGNVACDTSGQAATIKWGDATTVNGLKLAVSTPTAVTTSRSVTVTNAKGVTKTVEADSTVSGNRTITWTAAPVVAGATVTLQKSIDYSVSRGRTYTNAKGTTTNFTATVATTTPLAVTVTRSSAAPYALQTEVITSGVQTATKADGSVVAMTYSNVTYNIASNTTACQPVSGTITGTSTPAGGTATTFTIKFGDTSVDSGISITYAGGTAQDYSQFNAKDCDLARGG